MKRFLLVLVLLPLLVSCASGKRVIIPVNEQKVVMPPAILFTCPEIPQFPEGADYTQRDVAELVVELYRAGKLCKDNLEAVQRYLLQAQDILEKK